MNRAILVSLSLLLGTTALTAQNAGPQPAQTLIVQIPSIKSNCPVSLHAQQAAGGEMLTVNNGHPKGIGQGLHLILTNPDSRQIAGANVTIRGLTARDRMVQTLSNQDASDVAKTLDVTFPTGPDNNVTANLWVPGMTSVQAIELNSVTYADGSIWKLDAGNGCRTVPDGFMLVGNR